MGKENKKSQESGAPEKMPRKEYERRLTELQVRLCQLQTYVKEKGTRAIVIFEGRDAAGKGGVIKRITERVSPRVFRAVALPVPSNREKTQLYEQRFMQYFPAAGEIVLFDRSWYNRAGVERVMGYCTAEECTEFLRFVPEFEEYITSRGIFLVKYFFDVSQQVQEQRFHARATDPLRHWKLSPMDVESWRRWWDYTAAYKHMIEATDTRWAPWYRVDADDKRRARLNCIEHLLTMIPFDVFPFDPPELGKRKKRPPGLPDTLRFRHEVAQVH